MRAYILHPVTLLVLFVPLMQRQFGMYPPEFPHLGLFWDSVFYTAKMLFFIAMVIVLQPYVQRWFLTRNLPFSIATFLFFGFFLIGNFIVFHLTLLSVPTEGFDILSLRIYRQFGFSIFVHFIVCMAIEGRVRHLLGADPRLVPFFVPVPKALLHSPAATMLAGDMSGAITAMNAQNQYVAVYRAGAGDAELLRMSLSAAIARLPAGSGVQVHRSWWVAQRALLDARFDQAAMQIILADQAGQPARKIPVSKTYLPAVRAQFGAQP